MTGREVEFAVGRVLEYTETDRRQIHGLAEELSSMASSGSPGVAQVILKLYKITQGAIARSHATAEAGRVADQYGVGSQIPLIP